MIKDRYNELYDTEVLENKIATIKSEIEDKKG